MTDPHDRLFTGRLRVMQYASDVCILFACTVFAVFVGKHWAWGPCLVAAALIAVSVGANAILVHVANKSFSVSEAQRRRAAARRRTRNTVLVPAYVTFGIGFGVIAGSIPSYRAAFAVGGFFLAMTLLLPLVLWRSIRRRAALHQSLGSRNG